LFHKKRKKKECEKIRKPLPPPTKIKPSNKVYNRKKEKNNNDI